MGSTITTARVAAAIPTQHGRRLFVLFEESYSSNVTPHTPRWCCMSIGYLPATMERIFSLASSCEGGMLRNRSGRLTPEGYIGTWLKELANPLVLRQTAIRVAVGDGFYNAIHSTRLNDAVDLLAKADRPREANELHDTQTVTLDLVRDTDAVLALQAGLDIDPWRLIGAHVVSHRSGERDPTLGHNPAPGRLSMPIVPRALKLNENVRLLDDPDGGWRCGRWQYSLVGEHVQGLWRAELACPGHHRKRIAAFRNMLEGAPPAPAGLAVEIDASGTSKTYHLRTIGELRQKVSANGGVFRVPVTKDTEYALTTLPPGCARWLVGDLDQALPTKQVALAV